MYLAMVSCTRGTGSLGRQPWYENRRGEDPDNNFTPIVHNRVASDTCAPVKDDVQTVNTLLVTN